MKKIKILVLSCLLMTQAWAQDTPKFLNDYQIRLRDIVQQYPQNLDAQIFDISNKAFYNFLVASKNWHRRDSDIMAMMYFSEFKVNQKSSSFCFILYDSKSDLVKNYMSSALMSYEETINYLALHEMGHCLHSHQVQIGNIKDKLTPKEGEQLADMFSIAYMLRENKEKNALKVIRNLKTINAHDIHANYDIVKQFYVEAIQKEELSNLVNSEDIFKFTWQIFQQIKPYN